MAIKKRIAALRKEMQKNNIEACIILSSDPHMSEYLPEFWKTMEYISGFTGSAGTVVITLEDAGLWTDSRYFIQAEKQLAATGIRLFKQGLPKTPDINIFLCNELNEKDTVGINTLCCSVTEFQKLKQKLDKKKIVLTDIDLFGSTWENRPKLSNNKIFIHKEKYCGETVASKLRKIREVMKNYGTDYHFIGSLDDIAWIFNLRGKDVSCNPVFLSYALISVDDATLFIDEKKISDELKTYCKQNNIQIKSYPQFFHELSKIVKPVLMDLNRTNQKVYSILDSKKVITKKNPSQLMKSQKNPTEIGGIKNVMIRDGVALVHFWYWLEMNVDSKKLTELIIAEKLYELRSHQKHFAGISFDTIAGYNANGAIVHYKASAKSSATLLPEGFLLVDSGGQYLDGTTDITRTFALGKIPNEAKKDFTLVLKAMIQLSMAVFPKGTRGCNLDTLARKPLWKHLRNYGHGTGHGVGAFLNVHEGPQSIRQELKEQAVLPGMITSNEPGLYREGKYGIRHENLILCRQEKESEFGEFLSFETLTLCPFDNAAIVKELLVSEEIVWLNNYHARVFDKLSPKLSAKMQEWLKEKCKKI